MQSEVRSVQQLQRQRSIAKEAESAHASDTATKLPDASSHPPVNQSGRDWDEKGMRGERNDCSFARDLLHWKKGEGNRKAKKTIL